MKTVLWAIVVALAITSCDKKPSANESLYGIYKGIFSRDNGDTSLVCIEFTGEKFWGKNIKANYLDLGKGNFSLENDRVQFTDTDTWKPDMKKEFSLKGEYNINFNKEGTVRIWRNHNWGTDEFLLKKPTN